MTASNATIRIGSCLVNIPVAISQLEQRIFQTFQSGFFQVRASRKEMLGARFSVSQFLNFLTLLRQICFSASIHILQALCLMLV